MENKIIAFNLKYINMIIMAIVSAFGIGFSLNDSPNIVLFLCLACLIGSGWELLFGIPKTKEDNIKV
jgi:hypothetical protein